MGRKPKGKNAKEVTVRCIIMIHGSEAWPIVLSQESRMTVAEARKLARADKFGIRIRGERREQERRSEIIQEKRLLWFG